MPSLDLTPGSAAAPSPRSPIPFVRSSRWADLAFSAAIRTCAFSLFAIVLLLVAVLFANASLSLHSFGWSFLSRSSWDPVARSFGSLPFLFGTLLSSLLALLIAVPVSLGVAVFVLDICPAPFRTFVAYLTELLAAIPSIVYGLWGLFVLVPLMRRFAGPALVRAFGWTDLFREPNFGMSLLTASFILAIMIVPIIASVSRDLMRAVPGDQREAVLALGATRWEALRLGVLRNARLGILGTVLLGLGRALGETMAVTMVIGNHPEISANLLAPSYTLASVLANEFAEAIGHLYLSSLVEIGLILLLISVLVNGLARALVWAATRRGDGLQRRAS